MYRGQVTAVDAHGVYVLVPALHPTAAFGPLDRVGAAPAVGARVIVVDCGEESTPDLVVMTGGVEIADGTIVNADISASAAIDRSKIAGLPTSSTDNTVPRFDGTGGALQNSGVTISDTNVVGGLGAPSASSDAATKGYVDDRLPTGSVTAFAGPSAPSGWLLCYGQAVSRTTYAALFTAIGTAYGTGDGSTTFNLPDLRGRTVAGLDNMGGSDAARLDWANTLGTAGGAHAHQLTTSEMPSHTHTVSGSNTMADFTAGGAYKTIPNIATQTTSAAGGGAAHNNMQPTILLNWIIRT